MRFQVFCETSDFLETLGVPALGALPCAPTHTLHTSLCPHTHHGLPWCTTWHHLARRWLGGGGVRRLGAPKSLSLTHRWAEMRYSNSSRAISKQNCQVVLLVFFYNRWRALETHIESMPCIPLRLYLNASPTTSRRSLGHYRFAVEL